MLLRDFVSTFWFTFSKRVPFFALMNLLFFGSLFVGAFWMQSQFPPPSEFIEVPEFFSVESAGLAELVLRIFLLNFFVSGFFLVTLTGMVLFVVPVGVLAWRAWLWGALFSQLPTSSFFVVLPTLILEGEGYVVAAVAGIVVGLSWLRPRLVFGDVQLSRVKAFKWALREAASLYVAVAVLLLVAAVVEAVTLVMLM